VSWAARSVLSKLNFFMATCSGGPCTLHARVVQLAARGSHLVRDHLYPDPRNCFCYWRWGWARPKPAFMLAYYAFPRWYEFGQRRWNDTDRGKPKNSEKNLSQCHFVHHKSHMDFPGRETGSPRWEAGD
jgi:hypothetical protein